MDATGSRIFMYGATIRSFCLCITQPADLLFSHISFTTTHIASLQQELTFAETVGAVGELHQSFLCLVSDGGVGSLVKLLTQDLQLGKALDKETDMEDTGLISQQQASLTG